MQVVKDNRAFDIPRERTQAFFRRGDLHFATKVHLCFVCGAADPGEGKPLSLRRQFLDWSRSNEPNIVCVQAENAVTDLLRQVDERRSSRDLAVIESAIADTVDSLLLFPESPGSFAELGLFSVNEKISKKMLVAVAPQHQGDSFIILGPIKRINSQSSYSPQPIVLSDALDASFEQIRTRLVGGAGSTGTYGRRYAHSEWKSYALRDQLSIIDKLTDLSGSITEEDLFDLVFKIFGNYEKSDIRILVALLKSMDRIYRTEMGDIIRRLDSPIAQFIDGGAGEAVEVKASWSQSYKQHMPQDASDLVRSDNGIR